MKTSSENNEYLVTNVHRPGGLVRVKATKVWVGDEADKSDRKDVTFKLVKIYEDEASGPRHIVAGQDRVVATGKDHDKEMSTIWYDLPTVKDGEEVYYTIEEDPIEHYTTVVINTDETYVAITAEEIAAMTTPVVPKNLGWYEKKGEDEHVPTEDTTVNPSKTYYIIQLEITVTNTKGEIPNRADVIYVDPLNEAGATGKDKMIVKSTSYRTVEEAKAAATNKTNPPKDPSHEGKKFLGWALNWDENDNYVLVAMYSDKPKPVAPVVSYIDPYSGKAILVSKITNDKTTVLQPPAPKHDNMVFDKWEEIVDTAGNTMYIATFKCDCSNGSVSPKSVDKSNVDTGDNNDLYIWIWMLMMAAAAFVATAMARNRDLYGAFGRTDDYKPKH